MTLEFSLFAFLAGDTAVAAVVEDRIYGGFIEDQRAKQPCVVYARVTATRSQTLCGTDGKVRAVMRIDSYDKSYNGAKALAELLRHTLTDFAGDMYGTRVSLVAMDSEIDLDDPEPGLYRVSQTYFIWFLEE